jgi:hypothetical protein
MLSLRGATYDSSSGAATHFRRSGTVPGGSAIGITRSLVRGGVALGIVTCMSLVPIGAAQASTARTHTGRHQSQLATRSAAKASAAKASSADPTGTIYVSDERTNSVDVFPPGTNGDVAPSRVISGSLTGIGPGFGPDDVKVDSAGDVYASNFNADSITEFAPGASGNVAPICTIAGSNTGLDDNDDISLAPDGTLYVGNFAGNPVEVFAPGACGNVAPVRVIAGATTGLGQVDGLGVDATGTLYVDNTGNGSIEVFPPGANGDVAPEYSISGSLTGLSGPDDIVVGFGGQLFVTDGFGGGDSVLAFAAGAKGNVAPVQSIAGSNTKLGAPDDLAVDASGNIFVTDEASSAGPAMLEFSHGATGNVAPSAVVAGSTTTLSGPEGVAVAGPPGTASASLATQSSAASIQLGSTIHDTATLTGGTTPTGSIEFKLFGPSDPKCLAAPAYTSPFSSASGDGSYPSPAFQPTAAGTYSWVALYSGDENNASVATACGDQNESVIVASNGTCFTGPWTSGVTGTSPVRPHFSEGVYIAQVNNDWTLYVTHKHANYQIFTGTITTDGTFTILKELMFERRDRVTQVAPNKLTYRFINTGYRDGISFMSTCGSQVNFDSSINGSPAPVNQIFLGPTLTPATANPLTFTRSS